ncbi:hypothetical protein ABZ749_09055 [Micromonospora sp. NPDC047753]|uniref:hypothetical protein n=1 Tax=Micromonospora sp. NPDC047753 TaxID=3154817 RepID=UPI0033FDA64E
MALQASSVEIQSPALFLVIDLGRPTVRDFYMHFGAINTLWGASFAAYQETANAEAWQRLKDELRTANRQDEIVPSLIVDRVRLASPVEAALTSIATSYAPIAYGLAGMAVLERTIRLIMEWQRHREELRRSRMTDAEAGGILNEATEMEMQGGHLGSSREAVIRLSERRIIAVERQDPGSEIDEQ